MAGRKTLAPDGDQRAKSRSWLYMMLFLPYGVPSGFVSVALAYGLAQAHVPTVAIAGLVALPFAVLSWKVLWAPIVDCVWTYRGWHLASSLVVALGVLIQGLIPMTEASLPEAAVVVLLTTVASTGVGMAVSGLMAHAVSPARKGEAAGWCQAGNLGGSGIGGGLGLWLAQHAGGMPVAGIIVALICVLSTLALIPLIEPVHDHRAPRMIDTGRKVVKDLWDVASSRLGILALIILILPIGTAAAGNLFAVIAADWRASADAVALVTGFAGGLASAVGCFMAGFVADKMDRKLAYIVSGFAMALCGAGMAVAPRTPLNFVIFSLIYALTTGFTYATYFAVVLEAIGKGAAATKSQLMGAATNMPIALATMVEGAVQSKAGSVAMLWSDVALTVGGAAIYGLCFVGLRWLWSRRSPIVEAIA